MKEGKSLRSYKISNNSVLNLYQIKVDLTDKIFFKEKELEPLNFYGIKNYSGPFVIKRTKKKDDDSMHPSSVKLF